MGLIKNIQSAFRAPRTEQKQAEPVNNDRSLANEFLRNGNVKAGATILKDQKFDPESTIKGYLYAALEMRADTFADFCEENIISSNKYGLPEEHPYLDLIENSRVESEYEFWRDLVNDFDMRGEAFIFMLRRVVYKPAEKGVRREVQHIGKPTSIEQIDASKMTVLKNGLGQVVGYRERIDATHKREFLPEQIIHVYRKHPLDRSKTYSIFDAAKDYQHTINKGSEYSQAALLNNTNTPGIISTESILSDEEYNNLVARVNGHEAGKVIIVDGSSNIKYEQIGQDLDKSALPDVVEINRQTIFAVTGTSKTILGIEESGTTRETARVQSKKFTEKTVIPIVKQFISKLNFDYRTNYNEEFKDKGFWIEIKDISDPAEAEEKYNTRKLLFDNITDIVYSGYSIESAQAYMDGDIAYNELELDKADAEEKHDEEDKSDEESDGGNGGGDKPKDPKTPTDDAEEESNEITGITEQDLERIDIENQTDHNHSHTITDDYVDKALRLHMNDGELSDYGQIVKERTITAKNNLLKEIRKIQLDAIKGANYRVAKNAFDYRDIRTEEEEQGIFDRLYNAIRKYWLLMLPLIGKERLAETAQDIGMTAPVNLLGTASIQEFIKELSKREAESHTRTIYDDILNAANKASEKIENQEFAKEYIKGYNQGEDAWFKTKPSQSQVISKMKNPAFMSDNQKLYKDVQDKIAAGWRREDIERSIRAEYVNMSRKRANVLVGNEMAKAINSSQFMADYELLKKLNKLDSAYKQLVSSTGDPCPFCAEVISQGPIPFTENFVDLGDQLQVTVDGKTKVMMFNFEPIRDGVLHPNCHCSYQLILKGKE